jgi:hypothetical protein
VKLAGVQPELLSCGAAAKCFIIRVQSKFWQSVTSLAESAKIMRLRHTAMLPVPPPSLHWVLTQLYSHAIAGPPQPTYVNPAKRQETPMPLLFAPANEMVELELGPIVKSWNPRPLGDVEKEARGHGNGLRLCFLMAADRPRAPGGGLRNRFAGNHVFRNHEVREQDS